MKTSIKSTLISILSPLLASSIAFGASVKTCDLDEEGACRLDLPVHAASEYFDNSNPKLLLNPKKPASEASSTPEDRPPELTPHFAPEFVPKAGPKPFIARAYDSFNNRCKDTFKAYQHKQAEGQLFLETSESDFCGDFGANVSSLRGQIVRGNANLAIKIPPEAEAHTLTLKIPVAKSTRFDGVVNHSSFQRACAILNARLLSEKDVYFSYCHKKISYNYYADANGESTFHSKGLHFFSKPGFNIEAFEIVLKKKLARQGLEDPNFLLAGTLEGYFPLWEPPFDGGQRTDVLIDYRPEESLLLTARDLETQRLEARPSKNPIERFYQDKYLPATEKIVKFTNWLQNR